MVRFNRRRRKESIILFLIILPFFIIGGCREYESVKQLQVPESPVACTGTPEDKPNCIPKCIHVIRPCLENPTSGCVRDVVECERSRTDAMKADSLLLRCIMNLENEEECPNGPES
jgi:hypothetical protein